MAAQKRSLDDASTSRKVKKLKTEAEKSKSKPRTSGPSTALTEEVDFPRGGGTSFTPLEVKAFRAEAVKEANAELFKVCFSFFQEMPSNSIYRKLVLRNSTRKREK
jgi:rRNA biogenesis protein RRP5